MKKKRPITVYVLVFANVIILALLVHVNITEAKAAPFKQTTYAVSTGTVGKDADALFVLDRATQKLAAFTVDRRAQKLVQVGGTPNVGEMVDD